MSQCWFAHLSSNTGFKAFLILVYRFLFVFMVFMVPV